MAVVLCLTSLAAATLTSAAPAPPPALPPLEPSRHAVFFAGLSVAAAILAAVGCFGCLCVFARTRSSQLKQPPSTVARNVGSYKPLLLTTITADPMQATPQPWTFKFIELQKR